MSGTRLIEANVQFDAGVKIPAIASKLLVTDSSGNVVAGPLTSSVASNIPLIYDNFAGKSGAPVTSDSGHTYHLTGAQVADLVVSSNELTFNPSNLGAMVAYAQLYTGTYATPTTPITRLGGLWTLASGSTEASAFSLNVWNGQTIPGYSCAHLVIQPYQWSLAAWINGVMFSFASRQLDNVLPFGVSMMWEIFIDYVNGVVYVREPDGAIYPCRSPLIRQGLQPYYATWEIQMAASTDCLPGLNSLWADTATSVTNSSPQAQQFSTAAAVGRMG
jgi:hypothetical protein